MTDDQQRRIAEEIEQSNPHWLVIWGCYSRLFWALPLFHASSGTIVSAADGQRLVMAMQEVEAEQRSLPEPWLAGRSHEPGGPDPAGYYPSGSDPSDAYEPMPSGRTTADGHTEFFPRWNAGNETQRGSQPG